MGLSSSAEKKRVARSASEVLKARAMALIDARFALANYPTKQVAPPVSQFA